MRLRPVALGDEAAVRAATRELAEEGFTFALGLDAASSFADYVARLDARRHGRGLTAGAVPETFLLAEVDGQIVGRLSLRHALNDQLRTNGGHIGFGILRSHRRRGHASEILRQALILARDLGIERVLLTCNESNASSRRVIESQGGVFGGHSPTDPAKRLYWIAL
ncbi:GNAT family N-acetyltransferase [Devosia neptuniae]|uniref:GNAT family N-acetyltransferase n=1 Tax=Devosia neptuniae TaxID=191302 RepID=A0ABY6CGG1_9HYPH|nr:GNAT family N-acetyltransferase [Devosia neptuniae]UXN71192.1 GNAT family N-acetyltransferase [Devosia neptuniae]